MFQKNSAVLIVIWVLVIIFSMPAAARAGDAASQGDSAGTDGISIDFPVNIGDSMRYEASRVKNEFQDQAKSLFARSPMGWDWRTIDAIYTWSIRLPVHIPVFLQHVIAQGRLLGVLGSAVVLAFLAAVFYSLMGQRRVLARVEETVQPLMTVLPADVRPYVVSSIRVVVAALIPLVLMGAFYLINAFIRYKAPWFLLTGRLLGLWTVGMLLIHILREALLQNLFPISADHGKTVFRTSRIIVLYVLACIALLWAAAAFNLRPDVLALLKFLISLSIVFLLILLLLKKKALLSLLPNLPYGAFQTFLNALDRYYFPVMSFTFLTGLLWCFGYQRFCKAVWAKTWAIAGTFVAIMLLYHYIRGRLERWSREKRDEDEQVRFLFQSIKSLLLYATVTATLVMMLALSGLMDPLQRIMSFPVMRIAGTSISIWIVGKAILVLVAFIYMTRLLQAYLDYRVYPALGVEPGLAYALNTFLGYLGAGIGFLLSLKIVGLDFRMLLVFAGAIGIGIGLGLQSMAANVISGFSILFGRKLRKDDWIQVGDTLGIVTDIYLRATKVRTRDNIEYLIPNADFISNTIVNYTLSSPTIRIHIPVGVSYKADPEQVKAILMQSAEKHAEILHHRRPEVRFVAYGDNSIDFELLVWMDIREAEASHVRSLIYFTVFEALKAAGIEIPFPQRDLHIRSGLPGLDGAPAEAGGKSGRSTPSA